MSKEKKHPLCLGRVINTPSGVDHDCDYGVSFPCEECRFGPYSQEDKRKGKDPRAKKWGEE